MNLWQTAFSTGPTLRAIARAKGESDDGAVLSKTCSRCKSHKPAADFHKNRATNSGLATYCKACQALFDKDKRDRARGPVRITTTRHS
jgi:hypothetical protein